MFWLKLIQCAHGEVTTAAHFLKYYNDWKTSQCALCTDMQHAGGVL